jgi:enamine deaminase RidA (YjgF/YER057c/UK114 family)
MIGAFPRVVSIQSPFLRIYQTRFRQDYAAMNETNRSYFAESRLPARTCVSVTGLAYDALVEIDLVARRLA